MDGLEDHLKWSKKNTGLLNIYCYCSVAQLCLTLWDPMDCSTPGFPVLHYLLGLAQTHVHWVGDVIQTSHPLCSPSPPAVNLSQHQGLFQWVILCIRWPKYWSLSFSISPSNESSGLISFRMDSLDILAVQGTLKSLLQHHSSKASPLQCSAFFAASLIVQLVKNLPVMQETLVWFPGQENPLEKGYAAHSSILGLPLWLRW